MRLTLRTLLAYLHNVLDSEDAAALESKIKESAFASDLVHRIRTATQHARLGAPKLDGKGMGVDPNSVAAYLDSTLGADRAPEFERVCLESDIHLAEVAACHQILAQVLGNPADVPPNLRERVYELADMAGEPEAPPVESAPAAPPQSESASQEGEPPISNGKKPAEPKPAPADDPTAAALDVSGKGVRWQPLVLTLVVAFIIVAGGLALMGPFNETHPILGSFFAAETVAEAPVPENRGGSPAKTGDDQSQQPAQEPNGPTSPDAGSGGAAAPSDSDNGAKAPTATENPAAPTTDTPTTDKPPTPDDPPPPAPTPTGGEPVKSAEEPMDPVEPPAADAGRLLAADQVILRLNPAEKSWFRMSAPSLIKAGDQLIVPPTYRPALVLTNDVQLIFANASSVALAAPDEHGAPSVRLNYGRGILVTSGKAGTQAHLDLAGRIGIATFADAETAIAVEAAPYAQPGVDPTAEGAADAPSIIVTRIYALNGRVQWSEGETNITIEPNHVLLAARKDPPQLVKLESAPPWAALQGLNSKDRMAADGLEPALTLDRPASLSLHERVTFRRVEVAALAIRSLAHLGFYEPGVDALSNEWQHAYWTDHIGELRLALARGPESAAQVRTAIEKRRGEHADTLWRLLRGYSPAQLEAGEAEKLVKLLEHDEMDIRVLAFDNLHRITGRNFLYRPEKTAVRQRDRIRRWNDLLEQGQIVYAAPPTPFPELPPAPE